MTTNLNLSVGSIISFLGVTIAFNRVTFTKM